MNDYEDSIPIKIKKMEEQILELQNAVNQLTFALTEVRSVLVEVKNTLISTRHNTNDHLTDLYGAMDHLIINGGNFHVVDRQKIPVRNYV